jgi:hypothetical protein
MCDLDLPLTHARIQDILPMNPESQQSLNIKFTGPFNIAHDELAHLLRRLSKSAPPTVCSEQNCSANKESRSEDRRPMPQIEKMARPGGH